MRTIVITRASAQAEHLSALLQAKGAQVLCFPVMQIELIDDLAPLRDAAARLDEFDLAFFVSANAVHFAFEVIDRAKWPTTLAVSTVGPATVRALRAQGFAKIISPDSGFDSEAVLALPEFSASAIAGRRVLILRGKSEAGSRELLADTLIARAAHVERVACYQRLCADTDPSTLLSLHAQGKIAALTFTSSEGVRCFEQMLGQGHLETLLTLPCFAPHTRISEQLYAIGAKNVVTTEPADEGLCAALSAYFSLA